MSNDKIKTILVVDDEEDIREILFEVLERKGYKVLTASNGKDAFEIVKTQDIDLVLSDVQMPGGDGRELLENIRARHNSSPIVMIFSGFSKMTLEQCFHMGAEAVFAKPFDLKQILSVVEKALSPKEGHWKQRSDRQPVHAFASLKIADRNETQKAKVVNLGRGGFFVALERDFPKIDEVVSFSFSYPEKTELETKVGPEENMENDSEKFQVEGIGIVRWIRFSEQEGLQAGCGIEFLDLTEPCKNKVQEIISLSKIRQFIPQS